MRIAKKSVAVTYCMEISREELLGVMAVLHHVAARACCSPEMRRAADRLYDALNGVTDGELDSEAVRLSLRLEQGVRPALLGA